MSHLAFVKSTPHGKDLDDALLAGKAFLRGISDVFAVMDRMRDDGVLALAYIQDKYGFPDTATAQAAYDELNSLQAKLNTNASITDMNAAMLQAFAKFG